MLFFDRPIDSLQPIGYTTFQKVFSWADLCSETYSDKRLSIIYFFQSEKQRSQVLKLILANEPIADDVDPVRLAKMTEGFSSSDLHELCRNASVYRVRDYLRDHPV